MQDNVAAEIQALFEHVQKPKASPYTMPLVGEGPDSQQCISATVLANGNLYLASERLSVPPEYIIATIAQDTSSASMLRQQLRTMATIGMMTTLSKVHHELEAHLSEMDPYDISRTYTSLLDKIMVATDAHESTENININQMVMSLLPPAGREALKQLMMEPTDVSSVVIDEESD
jgi:hypothetical protein